MVNTMQLRASMPKPACSRRAIAQICRCSLQVDPWKAAKAAGSSVLLSAALIIAQPVGAELNKFEYAVGGEFGKGTAQQYGEADIKGRDFSNQRLQRSNFTAADCRDCDFHNSQLQGAYFIKSVVARANFEGADLSDALMDRAVIVEANLRNAILQRVVLTRSDLGRSEITGADFTNALLDKSQQMELCRYASGTNPVTGADTRKSLGCGSRRAFRASVPSNPEGPQVSEEEKAAFNQSINGFRDE